jgi:hypothetical protein
LQADCYNSYNNYPPDYSGEHQSNEPLLSRDPQMRCLLLKEMASALVPLILHIANHDPVVEALVNTLPSMPIKIRKALITLCRCRVPYDPSSRAYIRLRETIDTDYLATLHKHNKQPEYTSLADSILPFLNDYIVSPVLSGFISSVIRTIPFEDREDFETNMVDARDKEMKAAMERNPSAPINWSSILSHSTSVRHTTPLSDAYIIQPHLHDSIYSLFMKCRSNIVGLRLYPNCSFKTIGATATQHYNAVVNNLPLPLRIHASTLDLEILYHQEGIRIHGPTEFRRAMKYNDIRPRFFYARGPDQYYASRYVQPLFNFMIDHFPFVHRFLRFSVHDILLDPTQTLFIYDYDAFTSRLEEIRNFTAELASFFQGVEVEIVDTYHGLLSVDIFDILTEFNEACNTYPTVELQQQLQGLLEGESFTHTCGMLGIPGNITSATLLHGLHLAIVVMSIFCKCVGDDAMGSGKLSSKNDLFESLSSIGRIAFEKMEFWEHKDAEDYANPWEDTWHYTKRPLDRFENRIIHSPTLIQWPPLPTIFPELADSDHTMSIRTGCPHLRVAKVLMSFAMQFRDFPPSSPLEVQTANSFILQVARRARLIDTGGFDDEQSHACRFCHTSHFFPISIEEAMDTQEWIDRIYYRRVRLPVARTTHPWSEEKFFREVVHEGMWSSPMLTLMTKLGHAESEREYEEVMIGDHVDRFLAYVLKQPFESSYTVVVHNSCPDWMLRDYLSERLLPVNVDSDSEYGDDYDVEF